MLFASKYAPTPFAGTPRNAPDMILFSAFLEEEAHEALYQFFNDDFQAMMDIAWDDKQKD